MRGPSLRGLSTLAGWAWGAGGAGAAAGGRAVRCVCGRAEGTGRAILYGTTDEFLNYFGLKNLEELPPLPEEMAQEPEEDTDLFMTKFQEAFKEEVNA